MLPGEARIWLRMLTAATDNKKNMQLGLSNTTAAAFVELNSRRVPKIKYGCEAMLPIVDASESLFLLSLQAAPLR